MQASGLQMIQVAAVSTRAVARSTAGSVAASRGGPAGAADGPGACFESALAEACDGQGRARPGEGDSQAVPVPQGTAPEDRREPPGDGNAQGLPAADGDLARVALAFLPVPAAWIASPAVAGPAPASDESVVVAGPGSVSAAAGPLDAPGAQPGASAAGPAHELVSGAGSGGSAAGAPTPAGVAVPAVRRPVLAAARAVRAHGESPAGPATDGRAAPHAVFARPAGDGTAPVPSAGRTVLPAAAGGPELLPAWLPGHAGPVATGMPERSAWPVGSGGAAVKTTLAPARLGRRGGSASEVPLPVETADATPAPVREGTGLPGAGSATGEHRPGTVGPWMPEADAPGSSRWPVAGADAPAASAAPTVPWETSGAVAVTVPAAPGGFALAEWEGREESPARPGGAGDEAGRGGSFGLYEAVRSGKARTDPGAPSSDATSGIGRGSIAREPAGPPPAAASAPGQDAAGSGPAARAATVTPPSGAFGESPDAPPGDGRPERAEQRRPDPGVAPVPEAGSKGRLNPEASPVEVTAAALRETPAKDGASVVRDVIGEVTSRVARWVEQAVPERAAGRVTVLGARLGPEGGEVRLQLYPPHLGEMRLQLASEGARLVVHVSVGNQEAGQLLRQHVGVLQQALEQAGLHLAGFSVQVGHHPTGGHPGWPAWWEPAAGWSGPVVSGGEAPPAAAQVVRPVWTRLGLAAVDVRV